MWRNNLFLLANTGKGYRHRKHIVSFLSYNHPLVRKILISYKEEVSLKILNGKYFLFYLRELLSQWYILIVHIIFLTILVGKYKKLIPSHLLHLYPLARDSDDRLGGKKSNLVGKGWNKNNFNSPSEWEPNKIFTNSKQDMAHVLRWEIYSCQCWPNQRTKFR